MTISEIVKEVMQGNKWLCLLDECKQAPERWVDICEALIKTRDKLLSDSVARRITNVPPDTNIDKSLMLVENAIKEITDHYIPISDNGDIVCLPERTYNLLPLGSRSGYCIKEVLADDGLVITSQSEYLQQLDNLKKSIDLNRYNKALETIIMQWEGNWTVIDYPDIGCNNPTSEGRMIAARSAIKLYKEIEPYREKIESLAKWNDEHIEFGTEKPLWGAIGIIRLYEEDIRPQLDILDLDDNIEKTISPQIDCSEAFKKLIIMKNKDATFELIRSLIQGRKGKQAALVIHCLLIKGFIARPSFEIVAKAFGNIGAKSGFNKYFNNPKNFREEEITGMCNTIEKVVFSGL